jgi:hypothetical protein
LGANTITGIFSGCQAALYSIALAQPVSGSPIGRMSTWSRCCKRFYETGGQYIADNNSLDPYVQGSYLNAEDLKWNLNNFLNAALAGSTTDTMAKG